MKTRWLKLKFLIHLVTVYTVTFSLLLSLFAPAAHATNYQLTAPTFNLQNWNQTAQALQPRMTVNIRPATLRKIRESSHAPAKHSKIGEASRTLMLMVILSGVELVRNEIHNSKISGRRLSSQEYARLASQAALKVADRGDVWLGIASDIAITAGTKKQVAALELVLKDKVAKPLFVNLIKQGILSIIYYVGFRACAQLWKDARLMVDPKDFDRSEQLWSRGFSGVIDTVRLGRESDDARLVKQMLMNMATILIFDDELRENWFYNTWRLAIATGRFVTLASGIATATAIGSTIYPGAGTTVGFLFGVAGAVAGDSVPQSVKDAITEKFRDARIATNKFQTQQYQWRLHHLIESFETKQIFWSFQASSEETNRAFEKLKNIREKIVTAYFERLYFFDTNIQKAHHDLVVAVTNKQKPSLIEEIKLRLQENLIQRNLTLYKLTNYYKDQFNTFSQIHVSPTTPITISAQLEVAKANVKTLLNFLSVFSQALKTKETEASASIVMQDVYYRSFKEASILQLTKKLQPQQQPLPQP